MSANQTIVAVIKKDGSLLYEGDYTAPKPDGVGKDFTKGFEVHAFRFHVQNGDKYVVKKDSTSGSAGQHQKMPVGIVIDANQSNALRLINEVAAQTGGVDVEIGYLFEDSDSLMKTGLKFTFKNVAFIDADMAVPAPEWYRQIDVPPPIEGLTAPLALAFTYDTVIMHYETLEKDRLRKATDEKTSGLATAVAKQDVTLGRKA